MIKNSQPFGKKMSENRSGDFFCLTLYMSCRRSLTRLPSVSHLFLAHNANFAKICNRSIYARKMWFVLRSYSLF